MIKRFTLNYAVFSIFLDILFVTFSFLAAIFLRAYIPISQLRNPDGYQPSLLFMVSILLLWVIVAFVVSLYDPQKIYKAVDEFQTVTLAGGFFALTTAGLLYFTFRDTPRAYVFIAFSIAWVLLVFWRAVARLIFRLQRGRTPIRSRVLIIGAGEVGRQVGEMISEQEWMGMELVGFLDDNPSKVNSGSKVLGRIDEVQRVVEKGKIDDVILALPPRAYERVNLIVSMLQAMPVNIHVIPDYFSLALFRATADNFGGIPMINLRDPALNDYQRMVKRAFDIIVGGIITLMLAPVMAATAAAIKLDSPGPIFFFQKRVGENGRLFSMYKFRSMVADAESLQKNINMVDENGNIIHKRKDDPRITKVGHFIRRWSIDELPQFINVLRGDISLVGPRPELPWLVERYEPWQRKRFAVPQGITGWWQVNGRSDNMMHLHTDEDIYYIQNYSLWLDIYILLKTPWVVVRGKGAY